MRKCVLTAVAVMASLSASAEGYQVNSFSARQEGMGHVGVAMKLGAESNIFNPAGVAFSDKTFDISLGMSAIKAYCTATVDNGEYKTDNKVSTPFNVSAAFKIYPNLYAGVSLYTPYGSSINWGENWPGAVLNQSVDLKVFTVQPTVSWKILPNLSVGAGFMVSWGNENLNKGLVTGKSLDVLLGAMKLVGQVPAETPGFGGVTPASVNLKGTSDLSVGYNIGAMYDILPNLTVGANFRSKMTMTVSKGMATVKYANQLAQQLLGERLDLINSTNFKASMPCPYVLTFGVAYKPVTRLTLAFDAQLTGWGTYKYLDFEFDQLPDYNQHLEKNYKNSWTWKFGAQYALTNRFDLRAGVMVDQSPCNKEYYNPETPGMTKIEPSIGLSFRPIQGLSIDAAFMYVAGCGLNGTTSRYEDFIGKLVNQPNYDNTPVASLRPLLPVNATMNLDYKLHAIVPAIGISYSF